MSWALTERQPEQDENTMARPPPKQTSPKVSSLASGVLAGRVKPTVAQVKTLAATALGQDQTRGQGKKR